MQNQNSKPKTQLQERTHDYSIKMIRFINTLPKDIVAYIITKQLLRSSTSIGANVAEAQGGSSKRDFTNFFNHSLKSAHETLYWLRLLKAVGSIDLTQLSQLIQETQEIANILAASILTLKGKR